MYFKEQTLVGCTYKVLLCSLGKQGLFFHSYEIVRKRSPDIGDYLKIKLRLFLAVIAHMF